MRAIIVLCTLVATVASHTLHIRNHCGYTIWVGLLGNPLPAGGGFRLNAGGSHDVHVNNHWSGRVWGRTGCTNTGCTTGDCGHGSGPCSGAGGRPPATLAEITFDAGPKNIQDFYDVSLVDGYNLPMVMYPSEGFNAHGGSHYYCSKAGCTSDLNNNCPHELAQYEGGRVVACQSACLHFNTDQYCCRAAHNTPQTCPPFHYSQVFKAACPDAYSYAYDDQASTFTCDGQYTGSSSYVVQFC